MYTCGVTVYDECHIGHARSLYIFDVIRRYLEYRGYNVHHVRNITDIDDKIIKRANELKVPWDELVTKYIESYYQDLAALGLQKGILDGSEEPRATKNITEIITLIQGLLDKGYGYATDTGVYFSVRKFSAYGKLSGQSIEQMLTGTRKEADETKRDPLDFALWKKSKPGEPFWPSPWGEGRPGWHIECSAMSLKYLKTATLDIHAGGRDLIFPHHENEIAQSEAWTGKPFANYWMHHGLLTINAQKMSKSLGNFITIKDFLKKEGSFAKLKLFFLSAHYQSPIDYTKEAMHIAAENMDTFSVFFHELKHEQYDVVNMEIVKECEHLKVKFIEALDDDFNTPVALSILLEMVSEGHKHIAKHQIDKAKSIAKRLEELLKVLNLSEVKEIAQSGVGVDEEVNMLFVLQSQFNAEANNCNIKPVAPNYKLGDEIERRRSMIEDFFIPLRNVARGKKNFALADKIRRELETLSPRVCIKLEDKKEVTQWRSKIL